MTTILGALLGLMLPMAAPAQTGVDLPRDQQTGVDLGRDQTMREPRTDGASNNSVNRAAVSHPNEDQQFARLPGDKATPKSQWKTGDQRKDSPQARRKKSKRHQKKKTSPRKTP